MRKLPVAAQEGRRRQVIGLREGCLTHKAIAAQTGLTANGVSAIRRHCAERSLAGRASGPRGPNFGTERFLLAQQEVAVQEAIRRHLPDALGLPLLCGAVRRCGRWGAALRCALAGVQHGHIPGAMGLHHPEAAAACLRAVGRGRAVPASTGLPGHRNAARREKTRPSGATGLACALMTVQPQLCAWPHPSDGLPPGKQGETLAIFARGAPLAQAGQTGPDLGTDQQGRTVTRFMRRLIRDAGRKVFLVLDNLLVHRTRMVQVPMTAGLADRALGGDRGVPAARL